MDLLLNLTGKREKRSILLILLFNYVRFDFYRKICYNFKQIAKRAKKRFYFNVLKREKKRIIRKERKNRIEKKFTNMKER